MSANERPGFGVPGFGVYVHWPFCDRICPYCDFNVRRNRNVDTARWGEALLRDLEAARAVSGPRVLDSIFFGGGTPSLAPPDVVAAIVAHCRRLWSPGAAFEVTLEANPTDAERQRFGAFHEAGVTRLSVGAQSLNDAALRFLGRNHTGDEARKAVDTALSVFSKVSIDLIYALPDQHVNQWAEELRAAIALGAGHLSLYQLTIEDHTPFARAVARGRWRPPPEPWVADLFDAAQTITAEAGLPAYEISNHARPGEACTHNRLYWTGGDYVGVGPGAHGRITANGLRLATISEPDPSRYLERVGASGSGVAESSALSAEDILIEKSITGLRTPDGVVLTEAEWARLHGPIAQLAGDGLLERYGLRLVATDAGRRLLDTVLGRLFSSRAPKPEGCAPS